VKESPRVIDPNPWARDENKCSRVDGVLLSSLVSLSLESHSKSQRFELKRGEERLGAQARV